MKDALLFLALIVLASLLHLAAWTGTSAYLNFKQCGNFVHCTFKGDIDAK